MCRDVVVQCVSGLIWVIVEERTVVLLMTGFFKLVGDVDGYIWGSSGLLMGL